MLSNGRSNTNDRIKTGSSRWLREGSTSRTVQVNQSGRRQIDSATTVVIKLLLLRYRYGLILRGWICIWERQCKYLLLVCCEGCCCWAAFVFDLFGGCVCNFVHFDGCFASSWSVVGFPASFLFDVRLY